jgi:hypothetical protein
MRPARRSRTLGAVTLVELVVASGLVAVVGLALVRVTGAGWRRVESTERKITAAKRTHERLEALRHALSGARWAWIVAPAAAAREPAAGPAAAAGAPEDTSPPQGSPLMYLGRATSAPGTGKPPRGRVVEYAYSAESRELVVGARAVPGALDDVRFFMPRSNLVKAIVCTDEHGVATGLAHRERSTMVTAVHMQAQAEEEEFAAFAWEDSHPWCTRAAALHAGFVDPNGSRRPPAGPPGPPPAP